jgi:hypothetical protein
VNANEKLSGYSTRQVWIWRTRTFEMSFCNFEKAENTQLLLVVGVAVRNEGSCDHSRRLAIVLSTSHTSGFDRIIPCCTELRESARIPRLIQSTGTNPQKTRGQNR